MYFLLAENVCILMKNSGKFVPKGLIGINIGSGNGLVLTSDIPLSEPMLTKLCDAIWLHQATMSLLLYWEWSWIIFFFLFSETEWRLGIHGEIFISYFFLEYNAFK